MTGAPAAAPKVAVRALSCPRCGAAVTVRAFEHTVTAVCESCLAVLDAKDPGLRVLQVADSRVRVQPKIPLGARGAWRGATYEVIGFQQRTIYVDGTPYSWYEYLLFNPYRGFRYLTEYAGHWNDVATLRSLPEVVTGLARPAARLGGVTYRHFQSADAKTTFVLGEFPWQVRVGDRAEARDFVAPPRMLSAESTEEETTWSASEYVRGDDVWKAFGLAGRAPPPVGVFADQPNPHVGRVRAMWATFVCFVAALLVLGVWRASVGSESVLRESRVAVPGAAEAFVTREFTLGGRTSNVEVTINTDLENGWAYFSLALVNEVAGTAFDFGREVSYYHGVDQGESWSEGSRRDRVRIPSVPPGVYYLRVAPELPPDATRRVGYELAVRRDVPAWTYFGIVLLLLALPPVFAATRVAAFESARWAESDYASGGGSDEDDD